MSNTTFDMMLTLVKKTEPAQVKFHDPLEILSSANIGKWEDIPPGRTHREKAVGDWNRNDFIHYILARYQEMSGKHLDGWSRADFYAVLRDVEVILSKRLHLDDLSAQTQKDYYDFAFQKFVAKIVDNGKKFFLQMFKSDEWASAFAQSIKNNQHKIEKATVQPKSSTVTLENLDNAWMIGGGYFLLHYGPVVVANYLSLRKHKSTEEIATYLTSAAKKTAKISDNAITEIHQAIKLFEPYPKWFPIKDTSLFKSLCSEIILCDDNPLLECLKPLTASI